jgi:hypothetical protein
MTFGWGRRSCAGQALAEQGTNLSVARLIWAYKVEAEVDERGVEIPVDIFNYTQVLSFFSLAKGKTRKLTKSRSGSNCRPEPFRVRFTPINEEIKRMIIRESKR